MIFYNPLGAPQLACDHCGCRWFARTEGDSCYECGAPVSAENRTEYERALENFAAKKRELPVGQA